MSPDIRNVFVFAHQANIERYRKILQSYLSTAERRFVECRLAEEQAALQQLVRALSRSANKPIRL